MANIPLYVPTDAEKAELARLKKVWDEANLYAANLINTANPYAGTGTGKGSGYAPSYLIAYNGTDPLILAEKLAYNSYLSAYNTARADADKARDNYAVYQASVDAKVQHSIDANASLIKSQNDLQAILAATGAKEATIEFIKSYWWILLLVLILLGYLYLKYFKKSKTV